MNNFDTISFEELNVLETLAETHEGNTKIYLAKVESNLIVCKVFLFLLRPYQKFTWWRTRNP